MARGVSAAGLGGVHQEAFRVDTLDDAWQNLRLEGLPEEEYLQFRMEIEQLVNQ